MSGAELKRFLGPEGLSYVISLICAGPVRAAAGHCSTHAPADLEAFGDFVRRVQVPYYEEARSKFGMPAIRQKFAQASQFEPDPIQWTPRSAMSVIHGRPVRALATNREPAVGG